MSSITEQLSAAAKSQLEAQFQVFSTLASTAVDSAQKVFALNLNTTKASIEKSSAAARKLLAAKDPQEFFSLGSAEPAGFDKLLAYGRELYGIASTAQAELIKSAQTFKQVSELATTPVTVLPKTSPALAAAVSAAVNPVAKAASDAASAAASPAVVAKAETAPANEPVAAPPKAAKAPAKPKPAAAPIAAASDAPVPTKVAPLTSSFPAPPPKPIALAPESKPAKLKAVAPKARPAPGKQLDILSHSGKGKK